VTLEHIVATVALVYIVAGLTLDNIVSFRTVLPFVTAVSGRDVV
jgi:hypothetical protein